MVLTIPVTIAGRLAVHDEKPAPSAEVFAGDITTISADGGVTVSYLATTEERISMVCSESSYVIKCRPVAETTALPLAGGAP